jgi:tetratricopeptide (TPR) repeat protein
VEAIDHGGNEACTAWRAMLDMAAYLAPDAIPKSLFEVLVDDDKPTGKKRLVDAFNALARYSLATVDDSTVGVHRLLQKIVRDDDDASEYPVGALSAIVAVDARFPEDVALPASWALCEQLLPHALALADTPGDPDADPDDARARLIDLLNRVSRYLHHANPPGARSLATAKATLAHARRLLSGDHPHTLTSRSHLAIANQWAGRLDDAVAIFEALLADRERILGAEHPDTLSTRNNVAGAYRAGARVADAIAIYEALLADYDRILGAEHPATLSTRHNIPGAYQEAGRVDDALAIYEPLLADRDRILGAQTPPRSAPATTSPAPTRWRACRRRDRDLRAAARRPRADPRRRAPRHAQYPRGAGVDVAGQLVLRRAPSRSARGRSSPGRCRSGRASARHGP